MKKKEIIWRHILHETLKKRVLTFTQKDLAIHFGFSTCTVFNALKIPRKIGAIEVTGRFFRVRDAEKLLFLWATHRNLRNDILYATRVKSTVLDIEGSMPPSIIFGAFSAYRLANNNVPADYDTLYIYATNVSEIQKRFPKIKGRPNLIVLKPDAWLSSFGQTTPDVQTFVDIWNIPDWYTKDFLEAIKRKLFPFTA